MTDPLRHLPFVLVLFILLFTGATDLALSGETRLMATLLPTLLWLGLYFLGSDRRGEEE